MSTVMASPDTLAEPGELEPFEDFYRRTAQRMRGLAFVITGSPADLDEIVQDAYAAIYRRYSSGALREPDFYLKQTVVNRCRGWQRSRIVEREHVESEPVEMETITPIGGEQLIEDTLTNRDALWNALDRLGADQRTAVALRYLEDLSFEEVATLMSTGERTVAVATVRSWVHRGLRRLQEEVER